MKKNIIIGALMLVIGIVSGVTLCRKFHHGKVGMLQNDTIVRFDTIRYSRLELVTNSYRLNIPKVGMKDYVYIPSDSTTIIYRDSVRYVTLPRQYFFTRTADAEIYHSGIDSRIDSLNVFHKTHTITHTQTVSQTVTKRNELSLGIGLAYSTDLFLPVQLEYSYNALPWLSVYGFAEYELFRKQFGIGAGTRVRIGWWRLKCF